MGSVAPSVLQVVLEQSQRVLGTYRIDPGLILEHANGERRITQGGYGDRQIYELVQNGADELRNDPGGEIAVVLTTQYLYCANEGTPITPEGADTILRMSASRKRGGQIGRFGVGVKSVLSISNSPEFYSATGSFRFDKDWSAEQIKQIHPDVTEFPVLRMALPVDRQRAIALDPVLGELLKWATTVVRLPLIPSKVNRLAADMAAFPAEFCLFSPHVGTITLEDRRQAGQVFKRQIFQKVDEVRRALQEENSAKGTSTSSWLVFTRTHKPSTTALAAAGELHDRPEIDIAWAVPDRSGRDNKLGRFWAYFPTNYTTTLRGIVNAPWKTSEDRQNLYDGNEFNEELIRVMADLVVDSLPSLSRPQDPASFLDSTPARGREEPQWASDGLVDAIWTVTSGKPSLPDQTGRLRLPTDVHLHPADLQTDWLEWWRSYEGRPEAWVHHSVDLNRFRRASAELICSTAKTAPSTVREWLEALVGDRSPEASAVAVRIAADMLRKQHTLAEQAITAKILLTESGELVAPIRGRVFRRSLADSLPDATTYVDDRVVEQFGTLAALDLLGVHEADASGRFTAVVDQGFYGYDDARWTAFWELSRRVAPGTALRILRDQVEHAARTISVRTLAGHFRPLESCLLPGPVVPGDGSRDGSVAVDIAFHTADGQVLRELGLRDVPGREIDPRDEEWFGEYVEAGFKHYLKSLPADAPRPSSKNMKVNGANPVGPLHLLTELSDEGRAAFLKHMPRSGLVRSWIVQHGSNRAAQLSVRSPLVWMARKHGRVETSKGIRTLQQCVSPTLQQYGALFPVADLSLDAAEALGLPADVAKLEDAFWRTLLDEVAESEDDEFPGRTYELMFEHDVDVEIGYTRCRIGDTWSNDVPDPEIAVTASRDDYEALIREAIPAVLVPSDDTAKLMVDRWGMRTPSDVIEKEVRHVAAAEPVLLVDEFPHLKMRYRSKVERLSLVRCTELEEITRTPNGARNEPVTEALYDGSVLVVSTVDDLGVLRAVDSVLELGLGEAGCRSMLELREKQRENDRMRSIRAAETTEDKLLQMVGEDNLRRNLPKGLLESEKGATRPDGRRIARLALNAHGPAVLRNHKKDIEARIPEAAKTFRGDSASRQLVSDLGLPEVFAGSRSQTLDAVEQVYGPTEFPRLHDYQERLAERMFDLLMKPVPQRAMLCLPTGAGKTRVAAEAVIRVIRARGLAGRPVLWIAQTEELCEQAVQSWKFVWAKVGPPERLTISRLWSGNQAAEVKEGAHLVVAIDAKLGNCLDTPSYSWLRDAALVIVDEAHTSISMRYTQLLRSLGITYNAIARPLIGLTATPFRGFNDVETDRLVDRYGANRLDHGVFDSDPYTALQDLGVLSRVEHRELRGATIRLTDDELEMLNQPFQLALPSGAEQRLAEDADRNTMLASEIAALPDDWPVLLFATSVNHSRLMAALLNDRGITAAAIDSATPPAERRRTIEEYRAKRIRVITNYGVLAQGFDAPATRAVVVARPTYSPNVYMQMIGRGLRGPKNGGKDTCLILDVKDNITNYNSALAFTGFEHLWRRR